MITAGLALAAALLVYAGLTKRDALGALEVVAGAAALVVGGPLTALAVAALYVGFTVYVLGALRRTDEDCGCFGGNKSKPSATHVVIDALLAVAALAAFLTADAAPVHVALGTPFFGVVYATFLATATGLTAATLT